MRQKNLHDLALQALRRRVGRSCLRRGQTDLGRRRTGASRSVSPPLVFDASSKDRPPAGTATQLVLSNALLMVDLWPLFRGGGPIKDEHAPKHPKGNPKVEPTKPNNSEKQKVLKQYLINEEWVSRPFARVRL